MVRYFDYNPTYSHPGMPASTPTTFQNFVRPRPPNITNWPQPQMPVRYISNRRDYFNNPISRDMPSNNMTGPQLQGGGNFPQFNDIDPFVMMGLTPPSSWGSGRPGFNQPATFPRFQQSVRTNFSGGGAPLYPPSSNFNMPQRQQYLSPYQRIMQDYPFNWLLQ